MKQKICTVRQLPDGIETAETYVDRGPRIVRNPLTGNRVRQTGKTEERVSLPSDDTARLEQKIQQLLARSQGR